MSQTFIVLLRKEETNIDSEIEQLRERKSAVRTLISHYNHVRPTPKKRMARAVQPFSWKPPVLPREREIHTKPHKTSVPAHVERPEPTAQMQLPGAPVTRRRRRRTVAEVPPAEGEAQAATA